MIFVRLLYLGQYAQDNPFYTHPILDSTFYLDWADAIQAGKPFTTDAYHHPPGYAFFLAAVLKVGAENLFAVLFLQSLMLAVQALLVFFIAKQLFEERSAWLAFVLFSLCGPLVFYSMKILSETLFTTFLLCALFFLVRCRDKNQLRDLFLSGLFWGAAIEVRGTAMIYFPAFLLVLWSISKNRQLVKGAALLAAGVLVCVAPVLVRNIAVAGQPIAVASNWGENFYMANNPAATGTFSSIPGVRANLQQQVEDVRREASRRKGMTLNAQEAQRFWFSQALHFMTHDPGAWLKLETQKVQKLFSWREASTIYFYSLESLHFQPSLRVLFLNYGFVLAVFFLGFAFLPSLKSAALPLSFILSHAALMLIFWPELRFLLPVIPFLVIVAGNIARLRIKRNLAVVSLYGILLSLVLNLFPQHGTGGREAWYANAASALIANSDFPSAETMARTSISINNQYQDAWINLGVALWNEGLKLEAREAWFVALKLRPGDPVASKNLGLSNK
jgi:4-amino-4-deoxy-L-arabinose transferase-like glycosyltransferase